MGDSTQLDVTTLLIGLAVVVFAVSLAQLVILVVSSYLKKKDRKGRLPDDAEGSSNET